MMWNWHASGQQIGGGAAGSRTQGEVGCLLLTGATGFIGGNVLVAAVNAGLSSRLLCPGAGSAAEALGRLRANARQCGLPPSRTAGSAKRTSCWANWARRSRRRSRPGWRVTQVINCAAMASFSADERVTRVNVEDTLRFASHFAGSAAAAPLHPCGHGHGCRGTRRARGRDGDRRRPRRVRRNAHGAQDGTGMEAAPGAPHDAGGHRCPTRAASRRWSSCCGSATVAAAGGGPPVHRGGPHRAGHAAFGQHLLAVPHHPPDPPLYRAAADAAGRDRRDDCAQALLRLALVPNCASAPITCRPARRHDHRPGPGGHGRLRTHRRGPALPCLRAGRTAGAGARRGTRRRPRQPPPDRAGAAPLRRLRRTGYVFDNQRLRDEIGFEPLPITDYVSECMRTSHGVGLLEQMSWDFKA